MQGLRRYPNDVVHLDLGPAVAAASSPSPTTPPPSSASSSSAGATTRLSIDDVETAEARIQRLIEEHPVIIFSRNSCYMCHVMKNLFSTIGVHPTVIELDDHEIPFLPSSGNDPSSSSSAAVDIRRAADTASPSVFIGGSCVGGFESLVALHLSGHLITKLSQVGAL